MSTARTLRELQDEVASLKLAEDPYSIKSEYDLIFLLRYYYDKIEDLPFFGTQHAVDAKTLPKEEVTSLWSDPNFIVEELHRGVRIRAYVLPEDKMRFSTTEIDPKNYNYREINCLPHVKIAAPPYSIFEGIAVSPMSQIETIDGVAKDPREIVQTLFSMPAKDAIDVQKQLGFLRVFAFDVLAVSGVPIIEWPLSKKKEILSCLDMVSGAPVFSVKDDKQSFLEKVLQKNGEGVILKDLRMPYEIDGRSKSWIKVTGVVEDL